MTPPQYVLWAKKRAKEMSLSFSGDEKTINSLIAQRGFESGDVYLDFDVCGNTLSRPGLDALRRRIQRDHQVSHVFIPRRDRLARPDEPMDGVALEIGIRRLGITIVFYNKTAKPLPIGERIDIGDLITTSVDYHSSGSDRRDLADKIIKAQIGLGKLGVSTGGRPPYGFRRWLVKPDGSRDRELAEGEYTWKKGHHVVWLPVEVDHPEIVTILRIRKELLTTPASQIARRLTREGILTPDFGRMRKDNKIKHRTAGVWNTTTIVNIGRTSLLTAVMTYGKRSMGDQARYTPDGPRNLTSEDFLVYSELASEKKVKVIRNPKEAVCEAPAYFEPLVTQEEHDELQRVLDSRAGSQRNKPRSKDPDRNPLACRLFDCACGWVLYRSPYGKGFRYTCGLYFANHEACEHNHVDGETAARFALNRIRESCASPSMLAKLKLRLEQRAASEMGKHQATTELDNSRKSLDILREEIRTAKRNLARAKSDADFAAISEILAELSEQEAKAQRAVAALESRSRPCGDIEYEVVSALGVLARLPGLAAEPNNLASIGEACRLVNLRVFFRFEKQRRGKRLLNRVVSGYVTFGDQLPPVKLYEGPTGRRALRESIAASSAANPGGHGPCPDGTSSGLEGNSLRNVSRVLTTSIELFLAGVATWEPHVARLLVAA